MSGPKIDVTSGVTNETYDSFDAYMKKYPDAYVPDLAQSGPLTLENLKSKGRLEVMAGDESDSAQTLTIVKDGARRRRKTRKPRRKSRKSTRRRRM